MSLGGRLVRGAVALVRRRQADAELDEELRAFRDMAIEEALRSGATVDEARRAAAAKVGSVAAVKDYTHDGNWETGVESVWQDAAYAVRSVRRAPGFTATAILTLALGIGGTTAIFSVVDALFLRAPDGIHDPAAVRKVFLKRDSGQITTDLGGPGSWVDYATLRDGVPAFQRVAAYNGAALADLDRGTAAQQVRADVVSHEYFDVLRVRPAVGRFFLPEEDGPQGATPVTVISYGLWQRRFSGDAAVLGRSTLINGDFLVIIGVTEKGFTGIGEDPVDVWLPSSVPHNNSMTSLGDDWRVHAESAFAHYVARLQESATEDVARSQAAVALRHAAALTPGMDQTPEIVTTPITLAAAPYASKAGNLSLWLSLVAGLVLIVACANVASLLLARGVSRRREFAVRVAVGAGRMRIMRQQLTESTVLSLAGGVAGVLVARLTMILMRGFPMPPSAGRLDGRLLVFALVVSALTGMLFGLLPALHAVRSEPVEELRASRPVAGRSRQRTRNALVALQLALSVVLLIGAALFVRSVRQVLAIDSGVDVDQVLVARVDLKRAAPAIDPASFYSLALSRLSQLRVVDHAALVHLEPFSGATIGTGWKIAGRPNPNGGDVQVASINSAGPGYFRVVGTPILRGRDFIDGDTGGAPVAVVNEKLARLMADDGNAVGLCVPFDRQLRNGGCTRIIGVVGTQRHRYLEEERQPIVFFSWAQAPAAVPFGVPALVVRTVERPAAAITAIRNAIQGLQPDVPYVSVQPLNERIRRDVLPLRLGAILFTLFGVLALLVSGIGLYGVLSYFVVERTAEIGVRRSLGASLAAIVAMVCRQSIGPVGFGLAAGLAMAAAGTRYLASMLFGVLPRDAVSFLAAAAFVLGTALLAMLLPAWRAARVNPMVALRHE